MKKIIRLLTVTALLFSCQQLPAQKLWGKLQPGVHAVGFKTIKQVDAARNNRPMIISIWYPAKNKAQPLTFKDYLFSGIINPSFSNPTEEEKKTFTREFKDILMMPHLFGLKEESLHEFESMLNIPMMAAANTAAETGKFPTVIMSSEPESLSVTAEWLASQGFVIMAVDAPNNMEMPPENMIWDAETKDIVWLAEYSKKIEFVDQNKMAAMGFGGGIIPAFYLSMKGNQLKGLVNLEGAVFQPRSLITKSADYLPEKMKTPMLHIVSAGTRKNESDDEIRAIHTSLYRFLVENNKITHHDFSIFGRIMTYGLGLRNPAGDEVELAYIAAHQLILEFLNNCFRNDNAKFAPITGKGIFRAEQ